ncbi:homogentisate 1,2-dioxygenase [bacterium]|nr:homogentisate 1,2-dioxygenase [bacterium]
MPIYHTLGSIPRKRHTVFRKPDGENIYYEHLMGTYGFSGPASLLYRDGLPTEIKAQRELMTLTWRPDPDQTLRMRHFRLNNVPNGGSMTLNRMPVAFNSDVAITLAAPDRNDDFFYRNGQGDEIVYVSEGEGVLESEYGTLPYRTGDYVIIHRGITHRWKMNLDHKQRFLITESRDYVKTPERYRTQWGQFMEHSPFCERDIKRPSELITHTERGDFPVVIKKNNALHEVIFAHHPFDVVGWDGHYYPWALNIEDFEPITGSLHQPPPVHQHLEAGGFVMCSFVQREFDYHPEAIPAPYNHMNVMSDEILYYANDEFMSRKGIEYGSMTLHPIGLTHGPQPGKYEGSVGAERTEELAVMIDTFAPLTVSESVLSVEDESYQKSWLTDGDPSGEVKVPKQ